MLLSKHTTIALCYPAQAHRFARPAPPVNLARDALPDLDCAAKAAHNAGESRMVGPMQHVAAIPML
jgi:hypothetical protein